MSNDNTIEILYDPLTITKVYSQILDNANNRWDFYADTNSLVIPFTIEQVNRAILDAKKFCHLVRESSKKYNIDKVYADKAHDKDNRRNFNLLDRLNAIAIRNNASTRARGYISPSSCL